MEEEFKRFHSKADRFSYAVALPSAGISDEVLGKLGRSGKIRLEYQPCIPDLDLNCNRRSKPFAIGTL